MKAILYTVLTTATLMACPGPSRADTGRFIDHADVIEVVPLTSRKQVRTPRRSCEMVRTSGTQERRRRDTHRRSDAEELVPALLGGLLGGVVGNQFGGGNGNKAFTVLGAMAGASIASGASRNSRNERLTARQLSRPGFVERCRVFQDIEDVEEVVGYQVTYEYLGRTFTRTMDEEPGDQLRIHVELEPLHEPAYADVSTSM